MQTIKISTEPQMTTIILGNREFEVSLYDSTGSELFFKALDAAFKEIDELKIQNETLNEKLNSLRKVK